MTEDVSTEEGGICLPTQEELANLPKDERLKQAAAAAEAAANSNGIVSYLREKAAALTNPQERERMLTEAFQHETKAKGLTKKAKVLKSGTFQGAVGGAGIGAASAAGLGTVVGTLVGTVAGIPTTAVGGLVGAGTGLIHGPWVKLGLPGGKEEEVQIPQESIASGAIRVDEKTGTVTAKDPEVLKQAAAVARAEAEKESSKGEDDQQKSQTNGERRKPKKLEIRSKKQESDHKPVGTLVSQDASKSGAPAKRKPPKLEVRSKQAQKAA
jgi:hypothetical protein